MTASMAVPAWPSDQQRQRSTPLRSTNMDTDGWSSGWSGEKHGHRAARPVPAGGPLSDVSSSARSVRSRISRAFIADTTVDVRRLPGRRTRWPCGCARAVARGRRSVRGVCSTERAARLMRSRVSPLSVFQTCWRPLPLRCTLSPLRAAASVCEGLVAEHGDVEEVGPLAAGLVGRDPEAGHRRVVGAVGGELGVGGEPAGEGELQHGGSFQVGWRTGRLHQAVAVGSNSSSDHQSRVSGRTRTVSRSGVGSVWESGRHGICQSVSIRFRARLRLCRNCGGCGRFGAGHPCLAPQQPQRLGFFDERRVAQPARREPARQPERGDRPLGPRGDVGPPGFLEVAEQLGAAGRGRLAARRRGTGCATGTCTSPNASCSPVAGRGSGSNWSRNSSSSSFMPPPPSGVDG